MKALVCQWRELKDWITQRDQVRSGLFFFVFLWGRFLGTKLLHIEHPTPKSMPSQLDHTIKKKIPMVLLYLSHWRSLGQTAINLVMENKSDYIIHSAHPVPTHMRLKAAAVLRRRADLERWQWKWPGNDSGLFNHLLDNSVPPWGRLPLPGFTVQYEPFLFGQSTSLLIRTYISAIYESKLDVYIYEYVQVYRQIM